MTRDGWDPARYERFAAERRQPFRDLLALLEPVPGGRVVDLGCGTGEPTRELHETTRPAETLGIDSSAKMLEKARMFEGAGLRFEHGDIAEFSPDRPYDIVFSNAALHWVPDHERLLARLAAALAPGGQLAFQVPDMKRAVTHVTADEIAGEEPFRGPLGGESPNPRHVLEPEAYARILDRLGFTRQTVRLQIYGVRLASREEAFDWVEGSLLSAYRARLTPELYEEFLERYRERLLPRLPEERPLFFPYRRTLAWARRTDA
ncbi:MAG TPA: methyltransferase domain-containing protein [Thermoanaerobaculia bacterium]